LASDPSGQHIAHAGNVGPWLFLELSEKEMANQQVDSLKKKKKNTVSIECVEATTS